MSLLSKTAKTFALLSTSPAEVEPFVDEDGDAFYDSNEVSKLQSCLFLAP